MTDCSFCSEQKNCPWAAKEYLYCSAFKKKSVVTNGDRIRAMTDEELAEILYNVGGDWYSEEKWVEWLKEEYDE